MFLPSEMYVVHQNVILKSHSDVYAIGLLSNVNNFRILYSTTESRGQANSPTDTLFTKIIHAAFIALKDCCKSL